MDSENYNVDDFGWSDEEYPIAHVNIEENINSESISQKQASEYNPFASQPSQHFSQAGPSRLSSQPVVESETAPEFPEQSPPVKRKRGRPSKRARDKSEPIRGSQREKKCPTLISYESFGNPKRRWSEKDIKSLLAGLLEVGTENIEGLKSYLPHKAENVIKNQIRAWKEYARQAVDKRLLMAERDNICPNNSRVARVKNLDEWINYFGEVAKSSDTSQFALSNIFLLISEFGNLPPPSECAGIDFRAMYRYIHCMLNGIPPYGLNEVTTRVLLGCIDSLQEKLKNPDMIYNLEQHFYEPPDKSEKWRAKFGKTYGRSNKKFKLSTNPEGILNIPGINPLNLSPSALMTIKFKEEKEDEDDF